MESWGGMTLYVKTGCPWCSAAVAWLEAHGVAFDLVDVLRDPAAFARMREISGQSLAPTLETEDGRVLADFETAQLEEFLKGA